MAKVITGRARFAYVHVMEPYSVEEGKEKKYQVTVLIPKADTDTLDAIEKAIDDAIVAGTEKFGKVFKVPKSKLKTPLRDGDEDKPGDPTFEGMMFFNATSSVNSKPTVVARDAKTVITSSEEFYSGCFGRASVNFYPFSVSGNAGVAAGLNNLMKLADGERLSGSASAQVDFAEYAEGDDLGNDLI